MKTIDLNGIWQCKSGTSDHGCSDYWPQEQEWIPTYDAPVPGTAQEAMEPFTGDVHYAHNVYNARFVEEQYWLFTRTFTVAGDQLAAGDRVRLTFEGLDLAAVIYLNGEEVGRHANFYLPCHVDVTDHIRIGENRLDVKLDSGIFKYAEKDPGACHSVESGRQLRRVFMRKPQSAFEWDWSPRLLNVGIFKPCYVEIAPFFPEECSVTHTLTDDYSSAELRLRRFVTADTPQEVAVEAILRETGQRVTRTRKIDGNGFIPLELTVEQPRLWQPIGHGTPYRYTLEINTRDASGNLIDTTVKKIGLRKVEIDQSPRPAGGRYFRLLVNGERVFAKGGNMVPADILFSKLDRSTYEVLIDRALEDNFNALRVWGGGIYESDDFYDLCDEKGIVVWQDFINACASYPATDREFFENYSREITYEIRRLSMYASLVIYAGNNEIEQFMWGLGKHLYTDASLYYTVIPETLRREGDNRYYQPSSPWSPDGDPPSDYASGDQHPWELGFADRNYFKYRNMDCRFPNEGGILGPTSLPNMMAALGEGQEYLYSFDFKVHDNSCNDHTGCEIDLITEEMLNIRPSAQMPIPDYVYYGGFLQGEGLTEYILNFRTRMNDTTGSAIFWMYNDCWPATRSWTTVDYLKNRTPAFWGVKRSFAPVTVNIVRAEDGGYDIIGINDRTDAPQGKLIFGWANADGSELHTKEADVTLTANDSAILAHLSPDEAPDGVIPFAELSVEGEPLARRRFVERPYYQLGLRPTGISVTVNGDEATYLADGFVFGVCLDLNGEDGGLSDNFFDLYPGRPYTVKLGKQSGTVLYSYSGNAG